MKKILSLSLAILIHSQIAHAISFKEPAGQISNWISTSTGREIKIGFSSVEDSDVAGAFCKSRSILTSSEMEAEILKFRSGETAKDISFAGFEFKAESSKLAKMFQAFKVPEANECEDVICAAKKVWGNELGIRVLYLKFKYGFNASEYAYDDSARMSVGEINDVMLSIQDLPSTLLGYASNQQLTHFTRGSRFGTQTKNQVVVANSSIFLFDDWTQSTSAYRQATLYHEMGHNISIRLGGLGESLLYKRYSQCVVSKYGASDQAEDFAESFAMYRYRANDMKQLCPEKYAFFREQVFKGAEFDSVAHCTATQ